jgi:4'-phosphopantetheinyl transferase EntD
MIAPLLPVAVCAEIFADPPQPAMLPEEAAEIAGASAERRREFATVRRCARIALRQAGLPAAPVLPDADRVPRWPEGVVGSLTHCTGYRAAAVARADDCSGVGIDAEPHAALPGEVLDLILRDEERTRLVGLTDSGPDVHWDRVVFCAKEAAYKAWFPLTRQWLGFADVSTTVRLDGTFRAKLLVPGPRVVGVDLDTFTGRWLVANGLVVTATSVGGRRTP